MPKLTKSIKDQQNQMVDLSAQQAGALKVRAKRTAVQQETKEEEKKKAKNTAQQIAAKKRADAQLINEPAPKRVKEEKAQDKTNQKVGAISFSDAKLISKSLGQALRALSVANDAIVVDMLDSGKMLAKDEKVKEQQKRIIIGEDKRPVLTPAQKKEKKELKKALVKEQKKVAREERKHEPVLELPREARVAVAKERALKADRMTTAVVVNPEYNYNKATQAPVLRQYAQQEQKYKQARITLIDQSTRGLSPEQRSQIVMEAFHQALFQLTANNPTRSLQTTALLNHYGRGSNVEELLERAKQEKAGDKKFFPTPLRTTPY